MTKTKKSSRKSLKVKIDSVKRKIKELSLDKKGTASLLDELLSLKGQYDIEPTELIVPESDVVNTYDFGAFQLIRCKTCIIFKCTGYRLIAKPLYNQGESGGALYSQLDALCEMKEHFDEQDDKTKEVWNLVFNLTITILSLPLDAFVDDDFLFDVGSHIVKKKTELYKKILETPLKEETEEDMAKNQLFEDMAKDLDNAQESIEEEEK